LNEINTSTLMKMMKTILRILKKKAMLNLLRNLTTIGMTRKITTNMKNMKEKGSLKPFKLF